MLFGEDVPNITKAKRIAEEADIFVIIGTSLHVYPAANLTESVTWGIPCFIIDPGESYGQAIYGFNHIKTTAVEGVDILKEKLKNL